MRRKFNNYYVDGDTAFIKTADGYTFLVDKCDLKQVLESTWCLHKSSGYILSRRNGRLIRLHRMVTKAPCGFVVDHINGDKLDNRKENLRIVTQKENSRNSKLRKNNSSGYPGVRIKQSGRYQARIMVDRKEIGLGTFSTFGEAKQARIKAEERYFGDCSPSLGALKELAY